MSRTSKFNNGNWDRNTTFHYRQKKFAGARGKEFDDYCRYDAPSVSRQALEVQRVAKRMYEKGWSEEKVIRKLRGRYGLSQQEAREIGTWNRRLNKDWTEKPY